MHTKKYIKFIFLPLALITVLCVKFDMPKVFHTIKINALHRKIMENVKGYEYTKSVYSEIYFSKEDKEFVPLIQRALDIYIPILKNDFALDETILAEVILYPTKEDMEKAIKIQSRDMPMGAYYGGVLNVLSPRLWLDGDDVYVKNKFLSDGPIVHELSHLMLDKKTKGHYPIWFTEGCALYYENKYTGFVWRKDLKDESKIISYQDLKRSFRSLDVNFAYRRCYDIVNSIAEAQGEEALQNILVHLSTGIPFEKAYFKVMGKNIE